MNHKFITKVVEGIKVVYLQSPNLYTAYVGFHSMAGAYGENEQNLGVAHYLEHMFFKGTKNLNWEDITRKGTMLGGIQNACTGNYKVSYYLSGLPKDNFEGAVSLLSDMMFNSTFPEAELEKERTVIIEEMKSYQDDHDSFFYAKVANEFANEQTRNDIIGNMETLNNMNRDTLKHYHDTRYGKNNTILLIVGSMPEDEVFKTCAKYLKGNTLIDHVDFEVNSPIIPSVGGTLKMERSGIQQTYVCELFRKTGLSDRNVYNDLVSKIIGGGMNSLLFREVREKRGLCYGVGMSDWPSNNDSGSGIIYSSIAPSKLEEYREAVQIVKQSVIDDGFSEDDFLASKNALLGRFCRSIQNPESMTSSIAHHLLFGVPFDLEEDYEDIKGATYELAKEHAKDFLINMESNMAVMIPKVST